MTHRPLVVAVLHSNADDQRYQLYSAAYGLEMQIDDDWQAELVLLAPHEHLSAVTEDTAVTGEDTAIVSAGVTDVPWNGKQPDLSVIRHERNNWLLIAGSGSNDSEETIQGKLRAALTSGCHAILCISQLGTTQLATRLAGIDAEHLPQLVIAYIGANATDPVEASNALNVVQGSFPSKLDSQKGWRFIVGGKISTESAKALTAIPGVSGVLLETASYHDFGDILEILAALGDSDDD